MTAKPAACIDCGTITGDLYYRSPAGRVTNKPRCATCFENALRRYMRECLEESELERAIRQMPVTTG